MIIFNEPLLLGTERGYLDQVLKSGYFCGNGEFFRKCEETLTGIFQAQKVLLTSSGSSALNIAAELLEIQPGDEIILPSFAHVGTVSAFALRKANLVWCDIKASTRNLAENDLEKLITKRTRAVIAVNYAGMSDNIDQVKEICRKHSLILIEDNAQGIGTVYQNQSLGSFGDLAIVSFHQTKNVHCGEGGALIINSPQFIDAAQKIRDRGTDRKEFNEGKISRWTWWMNGSNYYLSELQAAFLYAQLRQMEKVNSCRLAIFQRYNELLNEFLPEEALPFVAENCQSNGHCYSILTESEQHRNKIIDKLHKQGIQSTFHYQPLHRAPYWQGLYKTSRLPVTEKVAAVILRLPVYYDLDFIDVDAISYELAKAYSSERKD
ncbi:MAG: dTDP-4-amino-4,6-dideoxygalactose transaminase [Candidatus Stygibacter frigidus]|nr:dTDP-4-amino-4,6-dideoxygalactose transaminase [Candidatus Stygibacter frigidus]